jgi:uncharacterized protein YkwD
MRKLLLSCVLSLAASLDAAAADLYAEVNRLRAGAGACAPAGKLAPLKPQAKLERAARLLAQGGALKQGLQQAGYPAIRSNALALRGQGAGAQAARLLDDRKYCRQLQDGGVSEVGVVQDSAEVWVVFAAPFAPSAGMYGPAAGQRVLELTNQARAARRSCGSQVFDAAKPLRWSDKLAEASRRHAEDMAQHNYFSHGGRDGSSPAQRAQRAGYRYKSVGENLAAGRPMSPEEAVAGWLRSPGHCANLMNPGFTEMGAAFAANDKSERGVVWAQAFGTPR